MTRRARVAGEAGMAGGLQDDSLCPGQTAPLWSTPVHSAAQPHAPRGSSQPPLPRDVCPSRPGSLPSAWLRARRMQKRETKCKAVWPRNRTWQPLVAVQSLSRARLSVTRGTAACQDPPGRNTGVGYYDLLQRIFLAQGSNLGLLHWQVDSLLSEHHTFQQIRSLA